MRTGRGAVARVGCRAERQERRRKKVGLGPARATNAARARNERGPHRMKRRNRAGRLVPGAGLEPARSYEQEILSL